MFSNRTAFLDEFDDRIDTRKDEELRSVDVSR